MERKGGYRIINLKDYPISDDGTIPGIYEKIEGNLGKPILLDGVNFNGKEFNVGAFVTPVVNGDVFEFEAYGYKCSVNDDDELSIQKIEEDYPPIYRIQVGDDITMPLDSDTVAELPEGNDFETVYNNIIETGKVYRTALISELGTIIGYVIKDSDYLRFTDGLADILGILAGTAASSHYLYDSTSRELSMSEI